MTLPKTAPWVFAVLLGLTTGCTCSETVYRDRFPDAADDDAGDATDGSDGDTADGSTGMCDWVLWNRGIAGGQVNTFAFDARDAGRVYSAAGTRVSTSANSGGEWLLTNNDTNVRRFAFPSDDDDLVLAASAGGILESRNQGRSWSVRSLSGLSVNTLEVADAAPLRIYAAVDVIGVVRSLDGGLGWASVVNGLPYSRVQELGVSPTDEDFVLAVAQEVTPTCGVANCSFLAQTTDGGANWDIVSGVHQRVAAAVAYCPADPDVAFAAVGDRVVQTADGGETWDDSTLPLNLNIQGLAIGGDDCGIVYAAGFSVGVYRSVNGGDTWTGPLADTIEDFTDALSLDGLTLDPADADHLFVAARSGGFESTDAGDTWRVIENLGNPPVRRLAVRTVTNAADEVWMATWGTGLWKRSIDDTACSHIPASLFPVDFAQTVETSPLYESLVMGSKMLSVNGGQTFTDTTVFGVMDIDFDPNRDNTVVLGTQLDGVKLSTNGGVTFAPINGGLTAWPTEQGDAIDIRAVVFIPGETGTLVAGTNGRGIFRTENDGVTWTQSADFDDRLVDSIVWNPASSSLFACVGEAGVARSSDGGASWESASAGLPSMRANRIAVDGGTGALYVGTQDGVFKSTDNGESWSALGDASCIAGGLAAPVVVRDGDTEWVVAASAGEGIFRHGL